MCKTLHCDKDLCVVLSEMLDLIFDDARVKVFYSEWSGLSQRCLEVIKVNKGGD